MNVEEYPKYILHLIQVQIRAWWWCRTSTLIRGLSTFCPDRDFQVFFSEWRRANIQRMK